MKTTKSVLTKEQEALKKKKAASRLAELSGQVVKCKIFNSKNFIYEN